MPWYEIRKISLDTNSVIGTDGDASTIVNWTGPHCAIGTIHYPGGIGYILYVKSSVTGDESDYVTDYKRRNPDFPHETTGDQFFSEEQFEVYRNLGFHALTGVFSGRDYVPTAKLPSGGPRTPRQRRTPRQPPQGSGPLYQRVKDILKWQLAPDVLPTVKYDFHWSSLAKPRSEQPKRKTKS